MYAECPQKYRFKYVDKIPEKPKHFFSFGSSVHAALEYFYGVKILPPPSLEQVLAFYKENWIAAGYKDQDQEAQYFEDGRKILVLFYRKHIKSYELPFLVEYNFQLEVDGVPVTGKVDRIDRLSDGRLAILDYKTGKALAGDRVQTDGQLTMYQMACEQLLGASVARLTFYHLPTLKEQTVERHSPELIEGLRARILRTAEAITQGFFEPQPEERKCRWCDYKALCPVFKDQPSKLPAAPSEAAELSALVDRYGELLEKAEEVSQEAEELKENLRKILSRRGYVRAFGRKYQVLLSSSQRWEFPDKKKILELIRKAGLYERILAPSSPKVQELMADPALDADLKAQLQELGEKLEVWGLKVSPI
jgi:RecB family exonuclease